MKQSWVVESADLRLSLIQFLAEKTNGSFSRKELKKIIENRGCTLNGQVERHSTTPLAPGDRVAFTHSVPRTKETPSILFEDNFYLAIDKPPGLVCEEPILANLFPHCLLVHRLDKETSGVLLLAKSEEALKKIISLFRAKKIRKTYLAISCGSPAESSGIIKNYMLPQGRIQGQTYWKSQNKPPGNYAETSWKLIEKTREYVLLECHPVTGRTHQLRVHLKEMGCPILGDSLYNKLLPQISMPRLMLHAKQLAFLHPFTEQDLVIESLLPHDFIQAWNSLGGCSLICVS